MIIDLDKYKKVRDQISNNDNEEIIIKLNGELFHIVDDDEYEIIKAVNDMANNTSEDIIPTAKINVVCNGENDFKLTYEEYEKIKQQINDVFDKTFKPKAEKMN